MRAPVTGLLLAAGQGSRFGSHKMLAPVAVGDTVGLAAARHLQAAVDRMYVVVRTDDEPGAILFATAGYTVLRSPDAVLGMAHSLVCGVQATADSAAWVVALGDMPFVAVATIAALIECWRQCDAIVVPLHAGVAGHPVVFPQRFGPALLALRGDRGARALLAAHRDEVVELATADSGVLRDVDTPADLISPAGRRSVAGKP